MIRIKHLLFTITFLILISCDTKNSNKTNEDECEEWLLIALEDQAVRFNYRYYAKEEAKLVYLDLTRYPIDQFLIRSFSQHSKGIVIDSALQDFKQSLITRELDSAQVDTEQYYRVIKEGASRIQEFGRRDSINFVRLKKYLNTYGFPSDDCAGLGLKVTRYQVMNHHRNKEEYESILEELWIEKKIDSLHYSRLKLN